MAARNIDEFDSDHEPVKIYFDEEEWNIFSANEKKIFAMIKRNYEDLLAMGANPSVPYFMLQKKRTEVIPDSQTNHKECTLEKISYDRTDMPSHETNMYLKEAPGEAKKIKNIMDSSSDTPISKKTYKQSPKPKCHKKVKKNVKPRGRRKRNNIAETSKNTRKCYNWPQCSLRTVHRSYLRRHIDAVHNGIKPYSCQKCSYKASQSYHIIIHTKAVHEVRKPHECQFCNYRASQAIHLRRHIAGVHEKLKPFKCEKCDYCSSEISNLRKHVSAVHENIKPYKCHECDYKAALVCNLRRHVNDVHNEIKPYSCHKCDFKSSNARTIQLHISGVHEGIKPYICDKCDFKTSWPRNLRKHKKRLHEKTPIVYQAPKPEVCQIALSQAIKKWVL